MRNKAGGALLRIYCTFFGAGFSPVAPGTVASLAAVLLYRWFLFRLSPLVLALIIVVLFFGGVAASTRLARDMGRTDPGLIVIDEICGQLLTLFMVRPSLVAMGLAFALFRFFDIIKPFPIRNAEKLPDGWGIMADDIVAGVAAGLVLRVALIFIRG